MKFSLRIVNATPHAAGSCIVSIAVVLDGEVMWTAGRIVDGALPYTTLYGWISGAIGDILDDPDGIPVPVVRVLTTMYDEM